MWVSLRSHYLLCFHDCYLEVKFLTWHQKAFRMNVPRANNRSHMSQSQSHASHSCLSYYDPAFIEATLSQLVLQVELETRPFSNRTKILVTGFSTNHKYIYAVNNGDENNMGCCELGTLESRYQDMFWPMHCLLKTAFDISICEERKSSSTEHKEKLGCKKS